MGQPLPIKWPGQSGKEYQFHIYPRGTTFDGIYPGLYMYLKETKPNTWRTVYIGQTQDLNERQKQGYKREQIDAAGATHICIHVNYDGEPARLAEESDLLVRWKPECNEQGIQKDVPPSTMRQVRPVPSSVLNPWLKS